MRNAMDERETPIITKAGHGFEVTDRETVKRVLGKPINEGLSLLAARSCVAVCEDTVL